uniref:Copia protein n=1 Tax=Cajanus cajan TaxID=3821 RepID=A0A151RG27_CAJCA|nr:Copia protein [Cajanus cajan]
MALSNFLFPKGNSSNRPPIFNGEGYHYWKSRMQIFIEAIDLNIRDSVENGPFIPTIIVGHEIKDLPKDQWSDDDRRKVQYNLKAKNIITSALGIHEYFRISNCTSAKEMWDTLKVTHEGTNDVKRSRRIILTHEYELFRMNQNESIQDMEKIFTHIINHLASLGKVFPNEDLINKVLRCLSREWKPKVTAIAESKDLTTMSLASLFGKLQEDEMELMRLSQNEDSDKNKRSIALKASSSSHEENGKDDNIEEDDDDDEDFSLFIKRFNKFLRNKGNRRKFNFNIKKKGEESSSTPRCYECNQPGHLKLECPIYKKKMEKSNNKNFKDKKSKKVYITWEENDMDSNDSKTQTWYIDSGCSKHMTGDASKFIDLTPKKSGHVTYGDNNRGKILGIGRVGKNFSTSIKNVLLVEGLKHSLLSVSNVYKINIEFIKRIMRYLLGTTNLGLWYLKNMSFNLVGYSDSDFAGCKIDRKSTSRTCHFIGSALVSWHSKKQNSVALSTAEAEYVAAGSWCAQILWMKQQLSDFGLSLDHIPIKCDNNSAINLSKNPVLHSRTKHIEIRHHFLRDCVQKGDCVLEFVETKNQLADIFTKSLPKENFSSIRQELGILDSSHINS